MQLWIARQLLGKLLGLTELWLLDKGILFRSLVPTWCWSLKEACSVWFFLLWTNRKADVCWVDGCAHCPNRSVFAKCEHIAASVRHSIMPWMDPLVFRILWLKERGREIFLSDFSIHCSIHSLIRPLEIKYTPETDAS